MKQSNDPIGKLNYLQQGLSLVRRTIGLFLSAGSPMAVKTQENEKKETLIPDIATEKVPDIKMSRIY